MYIWSAPYVASRRTYGAVAPGITSHWKFPGIFLFRCSVSVLSWPHLISVLDGSFFFHQIMSFWFQITKKNSRRVSKKWLKFACFWVKNKGGKKIGENQRIFTRQTVFALICTIFKGFAWNSIFHFEMDNKFFYNNLFPRRSGSKENSDKNEKFTLTEKKIIVINFADVGS